VADDPSVHWTALSLLSAAPATIGKALDRSNRDPAGALRELGGPRTPALLARARGLLDSLPGAGIEVLTRDDAAYPPLLKELPSPPPALFTRGRMAPDDDPAVAVVGARRATPYGLAVARYLGEELGLAGITVVSGLARGIDGAAHHGLLRSSAGRGLAVLGCGLDRVYPPENKDLAEAIARRGALVSEFPPGTPPLARNFPRRNRLISGLVRSVVVVEAAAGSGSLITARLALDQGREVFAVPGPITAESSRGANDLLAQGARPVASALDIVQEFPARVRAAVARRLAARRRGPPPDLTATEREIWEALDPSDPRDVDTLALRTGLGVTELVSGLLGLEIRGLARALPGARYIQGDWTGGGGSLY
jgi:DNA processing protein